MMNIKAPLQTGAEYDSVLKRDRWSRLTFLLLTVGILMLLFGAVGYKIGASVPISGAASFVTVAGMLIGLYGFTQVFPHYWIVVPQTAAAVTTNMLARGSNPNVPYGPGGHPKFPWETIGPDGNITLDILTTEFEETLPTMSGAVTVTGTIQVKVPLLLVLVFVGVKANTIEDGLKAMARSWLSTQLANEKAEDAVKKSKEMSDGLLAMFSEGAVAQWLEKHYGVVVVLTPISGIDFDVKTQQSRDALTKTNAMIQGIASMLGYADVAEYQKDLKTTKITPATAASARTDYLTLSGELKRTATDVNFSVNGGGNINEALLLAAAAGLMNNKGGGK